MPSRLFRWASLLITARCGFLSERYLFMVRAFGLVAYLMLLILGIGLYKGG